MKRAKFRDLKAHARILLDGQYTLLALVTFILLMAQSLLNSVIDYVFPVYTATTSGLLYFACSLLSNILYVILLAGAYRIYLNYVRGIPIQKNDLFFAFSNYPEHAAVYALVHFVISFSFSETLDWFLAGLKDPSRKFPIPVYILVFLLISLIALWLFLTFSMTLYLYCDAPWKKAPELLKESNRLMSGNRFRFLLLNLSFIGLELLAALSFGIGLLFVEPYVNMTFALFYKNLIQEDTVS